MRVAGDWKTYLQKYFKRERYHLPRHTDTHRVPEADKLNTQLDAVFSETKSKYSDAIEQHLQSVITRAEEAVANPLKYAETSPAEEVSKLV